LPAPDGPARRLRAIIVDDEPLSRRAMRQLLEARDDVTVVAEYATAVALDATSDATPDAAGGAPLDTVDVVFLDIEMPVRSGLDLARTLGDAGRDGRPPFVVFVTAHDEYALPAFDTCAVDYLTKPVAPARLARALTRVGQRLAAAGVVGTAGAGPPAATTEHGASLPPPLLARVGAREIVIPWADVTLLAAEGVYATVHAAGRRYLVRRSLDDLARSLGPAGFVRVHRSVLVRRIAIAELRLAPATRRRELVLRSGTVVPVSRRRHAAVARALRAGGPPAGHPAACPGTTPGGSAARPSVATTVEPEAV
jgi:two-component system LytT family response regulator